MESDEVRRQIRAAERAESAPWTDFPPTPSWYPAAVGLWAALLALGVGLIGHAVAPWPGAICLAVAVVGQIRFLGWYRRYRGTMPATGMPPELRAPAATLVVVLVGIASVIGIAVAVTPPWVAALIALLLVTPAIWTYERAYGRAMAAARSRLA